MPSRSELLSFLGHSGQEHILDAYDELTSTQQQHLAGQIQLFSADRWEQLNSILKDSLNTLHEAETAEGIEGDSRRITPPPPASVLDLSDVAKSPADLHTPLYSSGLQVILRGEGAVLLMAGGSGTRLGVTIPKGMFHCDNLPSGRTLFHYHCSRIRRMEEVAATVASSLEVNTMKRQDSNDAATARGCGNSCGLIPLVIMTSEQNDADTRKHFLDNEYFGLVPEQVYFFLQNSLPCFDEQTGKVLMKSKYEICLTPGGNGAVYEGFMRRPQPLSTPASSKAISDSLNGATPSESVFEQLQRRGVQYVQIFSVDNILAKIADPFFFGAAALNGANVVVKTVPKASASERVGVFAKVDGKWSVVEYTEIGVARASLTDPATGELVYNCANIASHCCSLNLMAAAAAYMQKSTSLYHAARKAIETMDGKVNGIKLEAFVFDVFHLAATVAPPPPPIGFSPQKGNADTTFQIVQVKREEEFAPIKNADGAPTDTPTTAAHMLLKLHTKWVISAIEAAPVDGGRAYTAVQREAALQRLRCGECQWEVSPLLSYQGESLELYVPQLIELSSTQSGAIPLDAGVHKKSSI